MFLTLLAIGCRSETPTCDTETQARAPAEDGTDGENILILVLDDVGVDKVGAYRMEDPPTTPRLDALFDDGLRFDRAYASPTCSPTRASMLTGRHPSRHGIGSWIAPNHDHYSLADDEITFAELAVDAGWATAAVGKWHLSVFDGHHPELDPQRQGFDTFHGLLANPDNALQEDGEPRGYWHWERIDDGAVSTSDTYLTTAQADDALDLVTTLPEPWLVYVGFSGVHVPLDDPPPSLAVATSDADADRYDAVLKALDSEIGRLLDGMGELRERTTILTIGDNGTPDHAIRPPFDPEHSKGSLFEGGIRVPLGLSGPSIPPGTTSDRLVHAVDVFATVADLIGVDVRTLPVPTDGVSLLASTERRCLLVEQFGPDGDVRRRDLDRAVVEADTKIVRQRHEPDRFTTVGVDPSLEATTDRDDALRDELRRYERALR